MLVSVEFNEHSKRPSDRLAARIAMARIQANLTQAQLGEGVGATQQAVSYWEKTGKVPGYLLSAIAKTTNQPMEFFRV